jgi:sugar phosphate isomerase/epimerase
MSQNVIAAQMYTVRDFTKTVEGFSDSVAKISAIGYTAAQVSSIGPIPAADVKKICDDHGIKIVNTHVAWPRLQEDIAAVIEEHHLWQCKHVAVGSMPRHFIEAGEEGLYQFIKEATEVGRTLHEAGLTFSYHNHSFEFMRYGDKCGLEILFDETDPRYVQAELDTYWIQFGGGDVCDWILRLKDRMPVIHFKDMAMSGWRDHVMKEVGEGNLNWPAILDACREANVEWYAVEQDICPGDPFDSLAISYRNMVNMGLS